LERTDDRDSTANLTHVRDGRSPADAVSDDAQNQITNNFPEKHPAQHLQPLAQGKPNCCDIEGRQKNQETELRRGVNHPH
jgi:hypothetical protein